MVTTSIGVDIGKHPPLRFAPHIDSLVTHAVSAFLDLLQQRVERSSGNGPLRMYHTVRIAVHQFHVRII